MVLDPVTRAHSERYVLLGVRLAIFGVLVLVLWQYSAALGLVGIISTVILANIAGWCVAASRMARLLHAQRRDLALFGDVGRIALVAGAAALVTVVARQLVQPAAAWRVLLICSAAYAIVYVIGIVLARVLRKDEVMRLLRDVTSSVVGNRAWRSPGSRTAQAAEAAVRSGS